jgi:hypothetical protein
VSIFLETVIVFLSENIADKTTQLDTKIVEALVKDLRHV